MLCQVFFVGRVERSAIKILTGDMKATNNTCPNQRQMRVWHLSGVNLRKPFNQNSPSQYLLLLELSHFQSRRDGMFIENG